MKHICLVPLIYRAITNALVFLLIYNGSNLSLLATIHPSREAQAAHFDKMDMGEAKNKKTVFIHIGLPKTGSSYLQHAFEHNTSLYAKMGLNYPNLGKDLLRMNAGIVGTGNAFRILAPPTYPLTSPKYWLSKIWFCSPSEAVNWLNPSINHLISSECLSLDAPIDHLKEIYSVFSNKFKVVFICFVRNPSDRICALYTEFLKSGQYKDSPEAYVDEWIEAERKVLKMIVDLASLDESALAIVNYDVNRKNLLEAFDKIVFEKKLSISPSQTIVNPSPSFHQVMILQLASNLELADPDVALRYIERSLKKSSKKFTFKSQLSNKIYEKLENEISAVNSLLPEDEKILKSEVNYSSCLPDYMFDNNDIEYLKELIAIKDYKNSFLGRITAPFRYIIPKLKAQIDFMRTRSKTIPLQTSDSALSEVKPLVN